MQNAEIAKNDNARNVKLVAVVRISGMVKVRKDVAEALDRLRLRRKYACVVVNMNDKNVAGMLKRVKHYITFGEASDEILGKLIKGRGESVDGRKRELKINEKEVISGLKEGKKLLDFKLKGFFRLHPPRKGIDSKLQYPKGVLGDNKKDINKLIERML